MKESELEKINKKASEGNIDALLSLGYYYYENKDYKKALKYYYKASDAGNGEAQRYIGLMFQDGKGVESNYETAKKWYLKGAEKHDLGAMLFLANLYMIEKNGERALKWFHTSLNYDESGIAQSGIAQLYRDGEIVEQCSEKALYWYKESAKMKNKWAFYSIGSMYKYGRGGVEIDLEEAVKWYRQSALQGNQAGQYQMGVYYLEQNNTKKAIEWFQASASQGLPEAQRYLIKLGYTQENKD